MKKPLETARRWLAQAEHQLAAAESLFKDEFWALVCFHAEQTAQLALKGFLFGQGRRNINIHSVRALASECTQEAPEFEPLIEYGMFLDRYYLTTRYPDALPEPAVPFQSFTAQEANQAFGYASEIVNLARAKISEIEPGPDC